MRFSRRRRAHGLRVNAVRGNVAALLVVRTDFGEPSARSVNIMLLHSNKREASLTS